MSAYGALGDLVASAAATLVVGACLGYFCVFILPTKIRSSPFIVSVSAFCFFIWSLFVLVTILSCVGLGRGWHGNVHVNLGWVSFVFRLLLLAAPASLLIASIAFGIGVFESCRKFRSSGKRPIASKE